LVPTTFGNTRVVRQGQGPLVVLMHGFAGSTEVFIDFQRSNLSQFLTSAGYSILMYDFFGHGHSDSPDITYSAELFASQLVDICLALNIREPFALVAHSMGASVAARFVAVHPELVSKLVLLSPSVSDLPMEMRLRYALRVPILREILASIIIPRLGEGVNWENPGIIRACWRLLSTRLYSGGSWNVGASKSLQNLDCMRTSQAQVLVLWGRLDRVVPFAEASYLVKTLPNVLASVHPTADHMGFADGPEETRLFFLNHIVDFLSHKGAFRTLSQVLEQDESPLASSLAQSSASNGVLSTSQNGEYVSFDAGEEE